MCYCIYTYFKREVHGDDIPEDLLLYAGRRLEVPCAFISGKQDWGNYQQPGALEAYRDAKSVKEGCFFGTTMVEVAGHWVQQEQSEEVTKAVLQFLRRVEERRGERTNY